MRSTSHLYFTCLMANVFQKYCFLSKTLQSSGIALATASDGVFALKQYLNEFDFSALSKRYSEIVENAKTLLLYFKTIQIWIRLSVGKLGHNLLRGLSKICRIVLGMVFHFALSYRKSYVPKKQQNLPKSGNSLEFICKVYEMNGILLADCIETLALLRTKLHSLAPLISRHPFRVFLLPCDIRSCFR